MSTWYWQKAGRSQPQGPIAANELRDLALSSRLGRNDLVWKEGMKEWVKASQLNGLFEAPSKRQRSAQVKSPSTRTTRTPNPRSNHIADTYATAKLGAVGLQYEGNPTYFSYRGRLRRTHYILQSLAFSILFGLIHIAVGENSLEAAVIMLTTAIVTAVLHSFSVVKRLHDLNLSGVFYWVCLIPLVNIIFWFFVLFVRGTRGGNNYGPDPRN